jgi:hypothetical protein
MNESYIICRKCNNPKPKESFLIHHRSGGFPSIGKWCKDCKREQSRLYYANNPVKLNIQYNESKKRHNEKCSTIKNTLITCKKCGITQSMTEFLTYHKTDRFPSIRIYCRNCMNELVKGFYENNKDKIRIRIKEIRNQNRELYNSTQKERVKRLRKGLPEYYIKQQLRSKGFTKQQIIDNPEIIEVQRLMIKTKRLCKTLQN